MEYICNCSTNVSKLLLNLRKRRLYVLSHLLLIGTLKPLRVEWGIGQLRQVHVQSWGRTEFGELRFRIVQLASAAYYFDGIQGGGSCLRISEGFLCLNFDM